MVEATDFNSALRDDALAVEVLAGSVVQAPDAATDFSFDFTRSDIQTFERDGDALVIILENGQVARIEGYYLSPYEHALVFQDEGQATVSTSGLILPIGALGAAGVGAAALAGSDGGGGGGGASGPSIAISDDNGGEDGIVSAGELQDGLTITGTSTPSVNVAVTMGNTTETTVADENGNWSVTFDADDVPSGELDVLVNAVATDADGRVGTDNATIEVDTIVTDLAIEDLPGEPNGATGPSVVNIEDVADPDEMLLVEGTVEPGATSVTVEFPFNDETYEADVDAAGNWVAEIPASDFPTIDETAYDVIVTAEDAAGNVATTEGSVIVDTVFTGPVIDQMPGDDNGGLVNAEALEDGVVVIGGTVEPGSTVTVELLGEDYTDTAGEDGTWTVQVPVGTIPDGDGTDPIDVVVTAVDPNGNTSDPVSDSFTVDNQIGDVTVVDDGTGGDGTVNDEEAATGITLTGEADPGSTITVEIGGEVAGTGVTDDNGDWAVTIPPEFLPEGDEPLDISITATDEAGNTKPIDDNIQVTVDTTAPDAPQVIFDGGGDGQAATVVGLDAAEVTALRAAEGNDALSFYVPNASGGATELVDDVDYTDSVTNSGTYLVELEEAVAALVVSVEDDAGNMQSTYTVFDAGDGRATSLNDLVDDGLNITMVDLTEETVSLTLDQDDVEGLTGSHDILRIVGDSNDRVTLTGFSEGGTQTEDGTTFDVYTSGETMVWVDQNIVVG